MRGDVVAADSERVIVYSVLASQVMFVLLSSPSLSSSTQPKQMSASSGKQIKLARMPLRTQLELVSINLSSSGPN